MVPTAPGTGIVVTAWRRPAYLHRTLESWRRARGVQDTRSFTVALGVSAALAEQAAVIHGSGLDAEIHMDSPRARASRDVHRALGEVIDHVLEDPGVDYVVCGEEDIVVSDDVLEYFAWAFAHMHGDHRILLACAHNRGGTGWDELHRGPQDRDASQEVVRAVPYFNPWVWGTSRSRWEHVLRPRWDWDGTSGTTPNNTDSGYDWNIQKRVIPSGLWRCLVPDAARSQNIGEHDGINSTPEIFPLQLSDSFTPHRDPVAYKLEDS